MGHTLGMLYMGLGAARRQLDVDDREPEEQQLIAELESDLRIGKADKARSLVVPRSHLRHLFWMRN